MSLELELELAEKHLAKRIERKKEYSTKQLDLTKQKRRRWLLQKGKGDFIGFKDE